MVRWVAREGQGVLDVSPTGSERRQLRIPDLPILKEAKAEYAKLQ
jgi:hypothetical protein